MVKLRIPATIWSYVSGVIAAIGWLILIDAQVYCNYVLQSKDMTVVNWIPCMIAFVGWILLNIVPVNHLILDSDHEHDRRVVYFARGWLFVAIFILFAAGITGCSLLIVDLGKHHKKFVWGALVTLFHPMLITLSGMCMLFGRIYGDSLKLGGDDDDGYSFY